jgi:hypothetical protein
MLGCVDAGFEAIQAMAFNAAWRWLVKLNRLRRGW